MAATTRLSRAGLRWHGWRSYASAPPASPSSPATASLERSAELTHWRITLLRSPLKLPKPFHDALRNLGLRKRMTIRYRKHSKGTAGLILKVKELLKVENVTTEEYRVGRRSTRKLLGDDRGYRIVGNILQDRVRERERVLAEMDEELVRKEPPI